MKLKLLSAFLLLRAALCLGQELLPRHAQAQIVSNDCQTFLHFPLKGIVQIGDIGQYIIRFPMSCSAYGTGLCYPVPIRSISKLGNLWLLDLSFAGKSGYGKDFAEYHYVTPKGSIATGEDEIVIAWNCGQPGQDKSAIWAWYGAPWVPRVQ